MFVADAYFLIVSDFLWQGLQWYRDVYWLS